MRFLFLFLLSSVSLFAQRTPFKVNGTVVNNPNLTNSATVTYAVNGANVTATAAGSSGTVGTVINTGASGVGNVPAYTDATGTNVAPFTALTLSDTNASLVGVLTANGVNATNDITLGGVSITNRLNIWTNNAGTISATSDSIDGTAAFSLDTSVLHTSGALAQFKNNGVTRAEIVGSFNETGFKTSYDEAWAFLRVSEISDLAFLNLGYDDGMNSSEFYFESKGSGAGFNIAVDNVERAVYYPNNVDGITPYMEDTTVDHTSGYLHETRNNGTNKFAVSWRGDIETPHFNTSDTNASLVGVLTANGVNATNFLRLNGVDVSTAAAANPTATIGLTAINGSASTFLRSDGAPALPSTGGAYHGAILTPWVDTNNAVRLQWKKAPVIWDFNGNTIGDFGSTIANSGSVATPTATPLDTSDQGVWSATTGTLTNGTAGLRGGVATTTFTTNNFAVLWKIKAPSSLSTDADGYELYAGLGDSAGDAEPTDGAYFYYLHSVSNGVWCAKTANNSVRSFASGSPTTPPTVTINVWYSLFLEGNSSVVNFWVSANDGATWQWIGYSTTQIPSDTGRVTGLQCYIRKVGGSVGTTSRTMYYGRAEFWPNRAN